MTSQPFEVRFATFFRLLPMTYYICTTPESHGVVAAVLHHFEAADTIGLLLLGGAFALLLLPMTLYNQLPGGWNNKGIIIMFVFGAVLMIAFGVWELKFCKKPLMSKFVQCLSPSPLPN